MSKTLNEKSLRQFVGGALDGHEELLDDWQSIMYYHSTGQHVHVYVLERNISPCLGERMIHIYTLRQSVLDAIAAEDDQ